MSSVADLRREVQEIKRMFEEFKKMRCPHCDKPIFQDKKE